MTKRDFLSLALKIMGVYFLVMALSSIPISLSSMRVNYNFMHNVNPQKNFPPGFVFLAALLIHVPWIIFSLILLKFNERIAKKLVGEDSLVSIGGTGIDRKEAFRLALRVIGAFITAQSVPTLFKAVAEMLMTHNFGLLAYVGISFLGEAVRLLVGVYCLLGASHVVKFAFRKD